jgi:tRNA pseudouridine55 synthase
VTGVDAAFNSIAQFRSTDGGILLVDKPLDWTSFDVIRSLRKPLGVRKMGHAGTLDPLATGLLILASQRCTKDIERYQAQRKTYIGTIAFGGETASYDAATPVTNERLLGTLMVDDVVAATAAFTGDIEQLPPMYSAVKVDGKRLYTSARKGEEVPREPRHVSVYEFTITGGTLPLLAFRIQCSKGTYVRSLAHDLGQKLGCGAWLAGLRRTAIGEYSVDDAWSVERLRGESSVPAIEMEASDAGR